MLFVVYKPRGIRCKFVFEFIGNAPNKKHYSIQDFLLLLLKKYKRQRNSLSYLYRIIIIIIVSVVVRIIFSLTKGTEPENCFFT